MIKILILAVPLLLLNNTPLMADNEFYLKIDLLYSEASKDSNSQRHLVTMEGKNASYEYIYSGFPDGKKESMARTLNSEEFFQIIKYIKNEKVNTSIIENKPQTANGPKRTVHLSLFLTLDGQTVESEISGILEIFRGDGKIEGVTIENQEYIDDIQSFIQRLKDTLLENITN